MTTLTNIMPQLTWGATGPEGLNPLASHQGSSGPGASADPHQRLQAAIEVEAIFLQQLLEQMKRAMVDPLSSTHENVKGYSSLANQHLARSLAARGGLGLAAKILEELTPPESHTQKENRHEGNLPAPGQADSPGGDLPVSKTS